MDLEDSPHIFRPKSTKAFRKVFFLLVRSKPKHFHSHQQQSIHHCSFCWDLCSKSLCKPLCKHSKLQSFCFGERSYQNISWYRYFWDTRSKFGDSKLLRPKFKLPPILTSPAVNLVSRTLSQIHLTRMKLITISHLRENRIH